MRNRRGHTVNRRTKKDLLLAAILVAATGAGAANPSVALESPRPIPIDAELTRDYPHWPVDETSLRQLRTIEEFVRRYRGAGRAAIFDWDGTLYSEKIHIKVPPSGLRHAEKPR